MRRFDRRMILVLLAVLLAIQFVRPTRDNPSTEPSRTLAAHHAVPHEVAAVLDRSCRDCHSNETRWPWYSNVAPVSWFVIDHVQHGRRHFNYSEWTRYDPVEARRLLVNACRMARERTMPLASYALVHRSAPLSDAEIAALCAWTESVSPTIQLPAPTLPASRMEQLGRGSLEVGAARPR